MNKDRSAELLMQLYDLRREKKMRKARNWIMTFFPSSADDFMSKMMEEKEGAYLRMVTSYWEMAASFVNHGAIDETMFNDITGEHIMVYSKIEPFLEELREKFESPEMYKHLEQVIMKKPGGEEQVKKTQEWMKSFRPDEHDSKDAAGA